MSQTIDTKVVEMQFDNSKFEKNIEVSLNSLKFLNKSVEDAGKNKSSLDGLAKSSEQLGVAFDNMNVKTKIGLNMMDMLAGVGTKAFNRISDAVAGFAMNMANSLSGMQAMRDGFNEYELKMGSVQTILNGAKIIDPSTGKNITDTSQRLEVVNQKLQDLNTYSDKTIYSFKDMTSNIGKFTNAGVSLDDSVQAIQGVANVAAISGANAGEASRAMYNFSQALSSGAVKLIDWKSIENANMATMDFKQQLLDTAVALGTVTKEGKNYISTTTDAKGAVSDAFNATKGFNDSLGHQWMTTEVLTQTLKNYSTDVREMSDEQLQAYRDQLKSLGYTEKQVEGIIDLSRKAFEAATEVKTFGQMIDTLKESLGSGWAQTFEIVIGDFEEAKRLFTDLNNTIDGILSPIGKARNALLQIWKDNGGRDALIQSFKNLFAVVKNLLAPIKAVFNTLSPGTKKTGKALAVITKAVEKFTGFLAKAAEKIAKIISFLLKPVVAVGILVKKGVGALIRILRTAFGKISAIFAPVLKAVNDFSNKLSTAFNDKITARVKELKDAFSATFGELKKRIANSAVIHDLVLAFSELKSTMKDLFGKAMTAVGPRLKQLASYFKKLWSTIEPIVSSAAHGAIRSLSDFIFPKLKKAIEVITDKLVKFKKTLSNINIKDSKLYKGLSKLPDRIKSLAGNIKLKEFGTSIKGFGSEAVEFLSGKFDKLKSSLDSITMPTGLSTVFTTIKDFIKSIFGEESVNADNTTDKLNKTTESVETFGKAIDPEKLTTFQKFLIGVKGVLDSVKSAADRACDAVERLMDVIITNAPKAVKKLHDFFAGDDGLLTLDDVTTLAYTISDAMSMLMTSLGFDKIGTAAKRMSGDFGSAMTTLTESVETFLKKASNKLNFSALKDFAIAVGIMAGAMFILAQVPDPKKLLAAAGAIAVVTKVLTKCFSLLSTGDVSPGKFFGNLSIAAILVAISVNMIALAASVGALVGALAAFPHVIKQYNKLGDEFSTGMKRVKEVLEEIFEYLDHLTSAKFGIRGALSLLGLVVALDKIRKTIVKYASKETGEAMAEGLKRIKEVLDLLSGFLSTASLASLSFVNIGIDFDTLGMAAMIWALSNMMVKISEPIERLSKLTPEEYRMAFQALDSIFFEFGGFIAAASVLSKMSGGFAKLVGMAGVIASLAGAIKSIVDSITVIAELANNNPEGLTTALNTLRGIFIELGIVFAIIGKTKPTSVGTIFAITIAVSALTACVIALYPLASKKPKSLAGAVIALGGIMLSLGIALRLVGFAGKQVDIGTITKVLAMTLAMVVLSNAIRRLAKTGGDAGSIVAAGAAISVAALSMAGALWIMGKATISPTVLIGLALITAAIWGIVYAINAFKGTSSGMAESTKQIESGAKESGEALKGVASENLAAISKDVVPTFFNDIASKIGEYVGKIDVKKAIRNLIENIKTDAKNWAQDFIDIGTNLIDGISVAIQDPNNVERVKKAFRALGEALLESFKLFFGINSPSTVMAEQGGYILDGLVNGLMEFPSKLADWVSGIGKYILDGIGGFFKGAVDKGKTLTDKLGTGIQNGKKKVSEKAKSLGKAALDKVGKVKEWGTRAKDAATRFASKIGAGAGNAKRAGTKLISGAKKVVGGIKSDFKTYASNAASNFASKVRAGGSAAKTAGLSMLKSAKSAFKGIKDAFKTFGKNAAEGFKNGISNMISKVAEKAKEMVAAAKKAAKKEQKSESPSKVFTEYGGWAAQGYAIGLSSRKNTKLVEDSARKMVNAATNAASNANLDMGSLSMDSDSAIGALALALGQISDEIDNDFDTSLTIRPVIDMSDVNRNAAGISALFGDRHMTAGIDIVRSARNDFEMSRSNNERISESIHALTDKIGSMTDTMNSRSLNNYINITGNEDPTAFADALTRRFRLNARTM